MTDILYQYKTNIFGIIHMSISSWACVFPNFNAKKAPNKQKSSTTLIVKKWYYVLQYTIKWPNPKSKIYNSRIVAQFGDIHIWSYCLFSSWLMRKEQLNVKIDILHLNMTVIYLGNDEWDKA